jgi:hypothetical protein
MWATKPSHSTGRLQSGHAPVGIRLFVLIIFAIVWFAPTVPKVAAQSSGATGYEVKTAFLFNFAKFIEWPASSFTGPGAPFAFCVLGQDPFGNILDDALHGKMIAGRPLEVRRLKEKSEARHCQMVFITSAESAHIAEILAGVSGANVLLVGESTGFAASGGTIEFTLEDNHVRFTINTDAATRSGLMFSSKLLALAKIVHDEGHPKGA